MMFISSSEYMENDKEGTFIVLVFERTIKKRMYAKNQSQRSKLNTLKKARQAGLGFADDNIQIRESKMRRFCNYFLTLFNVRKLNPFVQFIKPQQVKELKTKVMIEMDSYFQTEKDDQGTLQRHKSKIVDTDDLPPDINPNERMVISPIKERQALKAQASVSLSSSRSRSMKGRSIVSHPDQDRDILPPGYKVEPMADSNAAAAIEVARQLAYRNHMRHQNISRMKRDKMESMHEMSLKPKLELRADRPSFLPNR